MEVTYAIDKAAVSEHNEVTTQQAHNIKMMSYQRRCDVITSHRRWYDVILTLCAHWVYVTIMLLQYGGRL